MSTDRLVELFLQSARGDDDTGQTEPDQAAIDRAIAHMEMLMTSEEAAQVVAPASTFTLLGMALEEKPKLGLGAVASYKKALQLLKGSEWERCVLLQQLGAASFRVGLFAEARKWLKDCSELCRAAPGHPKDVKLFQGAFSTQQTRLEFASMVEKFQAQAAMKAGDMDAAQAHAAEAKRLQQAVAGDAVERVQEGPKEKKEMDPFKQLWAEAAEEVRLKQYSFMDEGPTVLVMLDLNEHLPIGNDASAAVTSLRQFRVNCQEKSVEIQVRLRMPDADGRLMHFILRLDPLCHEIVPEDTVPRLRGKESRRRLEVRLFKRNKDQKWFGDLVSEVKAEKNDKPRKAAFAPKGSLLNPLTPEEIAKLPKPGTTTNDNRPSSFTSEAHGLEASKDAPYKPSSADAKLESKTSCARPSWVDRISHDHLDGHILLSIQLPESPSDVSMEDLDLAVDDTSRTLTLTFGRCPGEALNLPLPKERVGDLQARWRKKVKTLELRFPLL